MENRKIKFGKIQRPEWGDNNVAVYVDDVHVGILKNHGNYPGTEGTAGDDQPWWQYHSNDRYHDPIFKGVYVKRGKNLNVAKRTMREFISG